MSEDSDLMNIGNARKALQIENMKKIAKDGVCPFCPEHLAKYHEQPIIKEGTYWVVTPNMYPYDNALYHFLFIAKSHITDTAALEQGAWNELQELLQWIIQEHNDIDSGTFLMRTGDMSKSGATVFHLHAQFVVGSNPQKPVVTRVG